MSQAQEVDKTASNRAYRVLNSTALNYRQYDIFPTTYHDFITERKVT